MNHSEFIATPRSQRPRPISMWRKILWFLLLTCLTGGIDLIFDPAFAGEDPVRDSISAQLPRTLIEDESVLTPDPNLIDIETGTWRKAKDLFPAPFPIPLPLDEETKNLGAKTVKKKKAPSPREYAEIPEPPETVSDIYTFQDRISQLIEFNNRWEVSFLNHGRFRIQDSLDDLYEYQRTGQFVEVVVNQAQRHVISLKPTKVQFRRIK